MTSRPSKSRITVSKSAGKPPPLPASVERDEVSGLEELHSILLDAYVFVSIAAELERDERWRDRITVLLALAHERVRGSEMYARELITDAYKQRRGAKKS